MILTINASKIAEYRKGIINALTVVGAAALYRYGPTNQVYTLVELILGWATVVGVRNKPNTDSFKSIR